MAGTTTVTQEIINHENASGIGSRVKVAWTSDASGNVSGTKIVLRGLLMRIQTDPDGTDVPTDNYDITLIGPNTTVDMLQGKGADRDTANDESVEFCGAGALTNGSPIYLNGAFEFKVANAGNAKKGIAYFDVIR